ncbi:MAG: DUF3341 domain-containing protein [Phycisphaerales bacterium JB039]
MAISDYMPFLPPRPARFKTEDGAPVYGVMAEFHTTPEVFAAAEQVRDAGFSKWDVYAPFPIHDIDEAMGMKRTPLPLIVAIGGFTGVGLAVLMQWWMTAVDYPLVVQGKNYRDWEPWVPIMFELGVLLASFSSLLGMMALNGLPRFSHPLLAKKSFLRVTDDRFVIAIEATDPKFDPEACRDLLRSCGAKSVELVEDL